MCHPQTRLHNGFPRIRTLTWQHDWPMVQKLHDFTVNRLTLAKPSITGAKIPEEYEVVTGSLRLHARKKLGFPGKDKLTKLVVDSKRASLFSVGVGWCLNVSLANNSAVYAAVVELSPVSAAMGVVLVGMQRLRLQVTSLPGLVPSGVTPVTRASIIDLDDWTKEQVVDEMQKPWRENRIHLQIMERQMQPRPKVAILVQFNWGHMNRDSRDLRAGECNCGLFFVSCCSKCADEMVVLMRRIFQECVLSSHL